MNGWVWGVLGAVASAVILSVIGAFAGVFQAGTEALDKEAIREVLREEMQIDVNGVTMTHGQVLSKISTDVVILQEAVKALTE